MPRLAPWERVLALCLFCTLDTSTNNTKSNTQHKNLNVSYTLYGTNSSNLSGSISRLAMVGAVARVVIKVKIDIKNGFGIWLF
jgi:hypothetical protein